MKTTIIAFLIAGAALNASSYKPKYGVTVKRDKHTNFAALKTYSWTTGWSAFNREIDRQVKDAVDRELAAAGLTKRDGEDGDMLVTYGALQRTDVDLKAKASGDPKARPVYAVGSLVVLLLHPETRRELYRARADTRLSSDPAVLDQQIDAVVKRMFEGYRTRSH